MNLLGHNTDSGYDLGDSISIFLNLPPDTVKFVMERLVRHWAGVGIVSHNTGTTGAPVASICVINTLTHLNCLQIYISLC